MFTLNSKTADNLYFATEHRDVGNIYPIHETHDAYEIYIIHSGKRYMYYGSTLYRLDAGDALMLPPGTPHRSFGQNAYSGICIEFSDYYIQNNIKASICKTLLECFSKPVITLGADALQTVYEYAKKAETDANEGNKSIMAITDILHGFIHSSNPELKISFDSDLSVIGSYIQKHFLTITSLDELTEHFRLSKSHLCRVFKQHTGITITHYINALKTQYASKLLAETNLPVSEIYKRSGYSNSQYFNRVFKKIRGLTPHQFKTQTRIKQMWNYEE